MVLNHQKNLIVVVMASVMQKFCQIAKNSTSEDLKEHMPKEHPPPPRYTLQYLSVYLKAPLTH